MGDFFSSMAFGDQLENFSLPRTEAESGRGLSGIPKPFQVFPGKTRRYIDAALQHAIYSLQKLPTRGGFQDVSSSSRV